MAAIFHLMLIDIILGLVIAWAVINIVLPAVGGAIMGLVDRVRLLR